MNALRRTAAIFVAALSILLLIVADSARSAEEKAADESAEPLGLTIHPRAGLQLQAAADFVKDNDWKNAVRLLQHLLDGEQGTLARVAYGDGKPPRYVSVHAEAQRLLSTLPEAGRAVYQRAYGTVAALLLDEASKDRDADLFARIVRRYLYTDSGPAVLRELAHHHYRASHLHLAAHCYAQLIEHLGVARWTTEELYQATVAFHHKNMPADADRTLKQLLARSQQNIVRLGERKLTVEELRKEIARAAPPRRLVGWPIYRGNVERSAQGVGGPPSLEPIWRHSLLHDDDQVNPQTRRILRLAEKLLREHHQPSIPAFSPIIVMGTRAKKVPLLVYKNYWGITVRNLKTGTIEWASPSNWSLEYTLHGNTEARKQLSMNKGLYDLSIEARKQQPINKWLYGYVERNQYPQIVFENSTVNTLSTDGRFVYVVDDLAVPPPRSVVSKRTGDSAQKRRAKDEKEDPVRKLREIRVATEALSKWSRSNGDDLNRYSAEVQDAIARSRLQVFELNTGKLVWESGNGYEKDPLADCYFLGPPLPLDGRLYLLVEKKQQVYLACLQDNSNFRGVNFRDVSFKLVSFQPLTRTHHSLSEQPFRRIQAAHLAYGDGILVCPTNDGVLLGVDLLSGDLAWVYPYREKNALPAFPRNSWKACVPVISGGKIVFTPPDAASIHCLNLSDGSLLWSRKKKDDELYLGGVYHGKALIVGTKNVQGVNLANGETLWTLETGMPSGQGIASDDVYYLPLKESMRSKEPEICAIDMAKGRIIAHVQSRPRKTSNELDVPGNLLFFEDEVLSLTPWEIVAYPLLKPQQRPDGK